jgi:hypothetical protein
MKKIIFIISLFFLSFISRAQVIGYPKENFLEKLDKAFLDNIKADFIKVSAVMSYDSLKSSYDSLKNSYDSLKRVFVGKRNGYLLLLSKLSITGFRDHNFDGARKTVNNLRKNYLDSIEKYETLYYYAKNVQKVNYHISGERYLYKNDTLMKKKYPFKKYSYESLRFFENDSIHLKYFKNNTVNFSPATRQMSLYTEILNDYFAAFRIGIGFQIKTNPVTDSANVTDSAAKVLKKDDLVGNLQNQGGGDFNINLAYPLIKNKTQLAWINYRVFAYGNLGVSLPFLNKSSSDFILNSDVGLQGSLYSNGFNENITLYSNIKIAHYFGNSKYRKIITDAESTNPTSFWLTKTSIGIAFMDGYRISFDLYPHFGNKFIKDNFPASISFTIRPSEKKN